MEKGKFDPKDERYKEVADLPPKHQEEFMDVKGGGFVSKDVIFNKKNAEIKAYEKKEEIDSVNKENEMIYNFLKEQNVEMEKFGDILITFKSGEYKWYRFHSVADGRLNVIDPGNNYGGTAKFMAQMRERGEEAVKNNTYTDSFCLNQIEEIRNQNESAFLMDIILFPSQNTPAF